MSVLAGLPEILGEDHKVGELHLAISVSVTFERPKLGQDLQILEKKQRCVPLPCMPLPRSCGSERSAHACA